MTRSTRIVALVALGVLVAVPSALLGKEVEDRKWIEVRTPNFEIRSLMGEKDAVELGRYLEVFRVAVSLMTNTKPVESPIPTYIYALTRSNVSKTFDVDSNTAGFFQSGLRRNTVVVRNTRGMNENRIIMHEYVHFLLRNYSSANYPMWYQEGFAEYLSTVKISSGEVFIGAAPDDRMTSFAQSKWIHLKKIIGRADSDSWVPERSAMFYAEAWALVHYLQNRPDKEASFGEQLQNYVNLMDSGTESVEAFEDAFAISAMKVNQNVRQYLHRNRIPGFALEADSLIPTFEPEISRMSRSEISLLLARYALRINKLDEAERLFSIAAEDSQFEAQAEAGLGDVLKFQDKYEEAEPHFERSVMLAPDDAYCQLDMAEFWHDRAENAADEEEENKATYLARARKHYVKAWKIDGSMPELYAMYGETFLMDGEDYLKAIEMLEEAQMLMPSSIRIRASLAEAYFGANRKDDAAIAARSVIAWSHGESDAAKKAQEILDKISESE